MTAPFRHQVLGVGLVLAVGLFARNSQAEEPRSTEDVLRDADLFHTEYRQDLAVGLEDAMQREERAEPGRELALTLILEARYRRLRGEFVTALARLNEAQYQFDLDPLTQIRILVERRWVEQDRLMTPWGYSIDYAKDMPCIDPNYEAAGEEYSDLVLALDTKLLWSPDAKSRGPALIESNALTQWQRHENKMSSYRFDIVSVARNDSFGGSFLLKQTIDLAVNETAHLGKYFSNISDDRLQGIRARLLAPVLAKARAAEAGSAFVQCRELSTTPPSDALLRAQVATACGELGLFFGAAPETLGFDPDDTSRRETYFAATSAYYDGINASGETRKLPGSDPALWLDMADSVFRSQDNHRGLARVAYLRAADDLAHGITGDDHAALDGSRAMIERSLADADQSGDLVITNLAHILLAVGHAVAHDRERALDAIAPIEAAANLEGAVGLGAGAARLMVSLAAYRGYVRYDSSSADILYELAERIYVASALPLEASGLFKDRATALASAGLTSKAISMLRKSLESVESVCPEQKQSDRAFSQQGWIHDDLAFAYQDLGDVEAFRLEVAALEQLVREFTGVGPNLLNAVEEMVDDATSGDNDLDAMKRLFSFSGTVDDKMLARVRAWRDQQRIISARKSKLMVSSSLNFILEMNRTSLARSEDRADIEENPDLPAQLRYTRYENANKSAKYSSFATRARARIQLLRGNPEAAREVWVAEASSYDAGKSIYGQMISLTDSLTKSAKRNRVPDLMADAVTAVAIGLPEDSMKRLTEVESILGSPTWYLDTQKPWNDMSTYVETLSSLGQHDKALAMTRQMLDLMESRRASELDERFRASFFGSPATTETYSVAAQAAVRAERPADAFEFMERGKARAFQDRILNEPSAANAKLKEVGSGLLLLEELARNEKCISSDEGFCGRVKADLARRTSEYDALLAKTGTAPPSPDSFTGIAERVRAALPAQAVLLSYYLTFNSIVVVALSKDGAIATDSKELPPIVIGRIRRLDSALVRRLDQETVQRDSAELARLLLPQGPVGDLLASPDIKELIIVPHSALHEIPFAYLPFDGGYLVERFRIRVLPFAGMLLSRRSNPGSAETEDGAVLFYEGDDPSGRLSLGRQEAEKIADLYDVDVDSAPRRDRVLEALTKPQVVHLIAHGISAPERGPMAHIDLPKSENEDGDLMVSDILLAPKPLAAPVVVLSSCELAMGRRSPGDDGVGIPRALLQKGVGTVVGSLWQLEDAEPVTSFMVSFHRAMLDRRQDAVTALATAQREAISAGVDPVHWAGFVAMGGIQ